MLYYVSSINKTKSLNDFANLLQSFLLTIYILPYAYLYSIVLSSFYMAAPILLN